METAPERTSRLPEWQLTLIQTVLIAAALALALVPWTSLPAVRWLTCSALLLLAGAIAGVAELHYGHKYPLD